MRQNLGWLMTSTERDTFYYHDLSPLDIFENTRTRFGDNIEYARVTPYFGG